MFIHLLVGRLSFFVSFPLTWSVAWVRLYIHIYIRLLFIKTLVLLIFFF